MSSAGGYVVMLLLSEMVGFFLTIVCELSSHCGTWLNILDNFESYFGFEPH